MARKYKQLLILALLLVNLTAAQPISVTKIEPPNWWIGMKYNKIQLMIYGKNLDNINVNFNNPLLKVLKVHKIKNNSYAFVDIEIPLNLPEGDYNLIIKKRNKTLRVNYPILKRDKSEKGHQGFNAGDVIYLITPDRFVNGDTSNDVVKGMYNEYRPNDPYGRHGGDIKGIISKLDYLKDLGVTAIWINPLVENNTRVSYHGYAATDMYKIDPRFGTNQLYKKLVEEAHKRDLKIIIDNVTNHISIDHPWLKNLPMDDWINGTIKNHKISNHNKIAFSDIHGAVSTDENNTDGWFTDYMPDLNQRNKYLSNYLIQNMLWWIEFSNLDGIREDTYPYTDQEFLSHWDKAILDEYPNLNIVGEVWINDPDILSYYQHKSYYPRKFDSYLPSVMDFAMWSTYNNFLSDKDSLYNIYMTLAKDFLYPNSQNLVTFLDNHDTQRAIFVAKGNIEKFKLAMTILLTSRGIPQILYGTEIGMLGGKDHGNIRADFPGGFSRDRRSAFKADERTDYENDIFNFVKKILHIRKEHKALCYGELVHFPPEDNVYIYIRKFKNEKILVIVNNSGLEKEVKLGRTSPLLKDVTQLKNLETGAIVYYKQGKSLIIKKKSAKIFLLDK